MIKTIKTYQDLPLEEGKTYRTKFQTGEHFQIVKLHYLKDKVVKVDGIYLDHIESGVCPISPDRLVHEQIQLGTKEVCSKCGLGVHEKEIEK